MNPSVDGSEVEPESNNASEKADIQTESPNPTLERVEPSQANSKTYIRKMVLKKAPTAVRRSGRLQNTVLTTENQDIERIFEEITVSESEKEDEPADGELPEHVPPSEEKTVYEKVDYIVQLLEAQKMTMDELTSRATGKSSSGESSGLADVTYKGLYIDSQKKVEALMAENYKLNKLLENALGKIEVYEKGNHISSDVLEKLKDIFLCSSLTRATEAALMSGAIRGPAENGLECRSSKKKRLD
ncbi:conserved hypothetical protein [Ricinus communis]|uniref:Uncharacterized protein n=2 Tax=Ricinus communis TaxID=3988 RepID=B9S429_RICCO|nr:conserved hypothetical protein [Ricinus communis]